MRSTLNNLALQLIYPVKVIKHVMIMLWCFCVKLKIYHLRLFIQYLYQYS